ncbi:MAG TPA: hypothetical protein VNG71_04915 [Pyrinomonadaceae bacterium]|nr:hypothetical protein [Pyrinomonadaceae bacterium]
MNSKIKWIFPIAVFVVLGLAAVLPLSPAFSAGPTIVVSPANQHGWSTADTRTGGAVNFVFDNTAPSGIGALQLTTDATNAAKAQYMHAATTPLADVSELSYYTKQVSAPLFASADPSYQLPVCLGGFTTPTLINPSGCVGFTTFVFEPYENLGLGSPGFGVIPNVWQQWDVDAGDFWSSRNFSDGGCTVVAGAGGPPFYTLAGLKAMCPNAVVAGFGVNVGTFNPSYNVYTDLVDFNGTTYDFEPFEIATDKDQCKDGGWKTVFRADHSSFKNQGDCVSYTVNGK